MKGKYLRQKNEKTVGDKPASDGLSPRLAIPFFLVLALLTVVSLILPLRPARSQMEKRELASFPEYSWESLISGQYFDDISLWFSDTFPGREHWIALSSRISSLHGHSEIAIEGSIPQSMDSVPQEVPEPREPAESVQPSETLQASAETVPEETQWGGVDAEGGELQLGAVIQIGDTAFNYQGFSQPMSDRYAASLSGLAERLAPKGVRVVSAPAPTAVGIMVEKEYLKSMRCVDQEQVINYMHGRMSEDVVKVDTFSAMIDHNREYLYFRTDHHWTALGAYYTYAAICEARDMTPAPLDSFEVWDQGEFQGSIYWKSPRPRKLRSDNVYAYIPQGDIVNLVCGNDGFGTERPLLQDMTKRALNEKYLTFLWSDNPLCIVTNNSLPDAPDCILVKDSFGNCLAPFLTQNYHKIYAIDYRKYYAMGVNEMVEKYGIQDVIFAPYLTATQAIDGNDMFAKCCR